MGGHSPSIYRYCPKKDIWLPDDESHELTAADWGAVQEACNWAAAQLDTDPGNVTLLKVKRVSPYPCIRVKVRDPVGVDRRVRILGASTFRWEAEKSSCCTIL